MWCFFLGLAAWGQAPLEPGKPTFWFAIDKEMNFHRYDRSGRRLCFEDLKPFTSIGYVALNPVDGRIAFTGVHKYLNGGKPSVFILSPDERIQLLFSTYPRDRIRGKKDRQAWEAHLAGIEKAVFHRSRTALSLQEEFNKYYTRYTKELEKKKKLIPLMDPKTGKSNHGQLPGTARMPPALRARLQWSEPLGMYKMPIGLGWSEDGRSLLLYLPQRVVFIQLGAGTLKDLNFSGFPGFSANTARDHGWDAPHFPRFYSRERIVRVDNAGDLVLEHVLNLPIGKPRVFGEERKGGPFHAPAAAEVVTSPDGSFIRIKNAIFNREGELLIHLDPNDHAVLSPDQQFLAIFESNFQFLNVPRTNVKPYSLIQVYRTENFEKVHELPVRFRYNGLAFVTNNKEILAFLSRDGDAEIEYHRYILPFPETEQRVTLPKLRNYQFRGERIWYIANKNEAGYFDVEGWRQKLFNLPEEPRYWTLFGDTDSLNAQPL